MTTFQDVKQGRVTLAELVEMNQYLELISDVEYYNTEKRMKGGRGQYGGIGSKRAHR